MGHERLRNVRGPETEWGEHLPEDEYDAAAISATAKS